jgi:hypothetical protein
MFVGGIIGDGARQDKGRAGRCHGRFSGELIRASISAAGSIHPLVELRMPIREVRYYGWEVLRIGHSAHRINRAR